MRCSIYENKMLPFLGYAGTNGPANSSGGVRTDQDKEGREDQGY